MFNKFFLLLLSKHTKKIFFSNIVYIVPLTFWNYYIYSESFFPFANIFLVHYLSYSCNMYTMYNIFILLM